MTTSTRARFGYATSVRSHLVAVVDRPAATSTRSIRTVVTVAIVGLGITAVAALLVFAALTLGVHPIPAAHTVVTWGHPPVLAHGPLSVQHLPMAPGVAGALPSVP